MGFFLLAIGLGGVSLAQHAEHGGAGEAHDAAYGSRAHSSGWEGSPEGKAYSEFNHHLAGVFVILIAISEGAALTGRMTLAWLRLLLPTAMAGAGVFLLIWSDHDAWPIGSMSLSQTLLGGDPEILQHKLYGVLLLGIGTIEWRRRRGALSHRAWQMPLAMFAIVGGLMLFMHSHGDHPGAERIAVHHAIMGTLAITAGSSKLAADGLPRPGWRAAWPVLILLIGLQLLIYSE